MQISSDFKINIVSENATQGVYSFEPLPKGFGNTLGSSLRRVLLTSIKGAAITQAKITGADHQFTTIPGVKEDIVEITLNLKKVRVKSFSDNPIVLNINKKGPGPVTAGDIETTSDAEIINKDLVIATLSDKTTVLKMELIVEAGIGYSPMEERQSAKIGVIILDALYSPVLNAIYSVETARSGKDINLDKLVLTVETDGSISPKDAVAQSALALRDMFWRISQWHMQPMTEEEIREADMPKSRKGGSAEAISVDELPLPTRTINALKKHGIETLDELAGKTDEELADIKNLGEKSVQEIKKLLKKEGFN